MNFKSFIPHTVAIVLFIAITFIYFSPLLKGKDIKQGDITNFNGMSKEIVDFRNTYHEEPLWTNSMFGGMPAYQISVLYPANLIAYVNRVITLWLPSPANFLFLYLIGFYILLLTLKIDPWLGIIGAVAFAFSSYFFIIIEAGHNSKAHAIGYMAPVLAGIILTFRGRYLIGGLLTALFMALELYANHLQITYYLSFIIIIYGIIELIDKIKNKQLFLFLKPVGVLTLACALAVGCNITSLWATYDYGKDTTRGKSDLTLNKENATSGLDKDYATGWSYGKEETLTLIIPNFKGGPSGRIGDNKDALKKNIDPQMKQHIAQADQYWGDQPFTSGPVYAGAIVFFLFILGLFFVKGRLKWAFFIATVISIILAWGKNFMGLTDLFLDYFPGYNKFRAVSMILVIAELTIPLIAILALDKITQNGGLLKEKVKLPFLSTLLTKQKLFYVTFALTGGIALIYYLIPEALTNFFKTGEYNNIYDQISKNNSSEIANTFLENLETARKNIFTADAIRSFLFISLAAGLIWFYLKSKLDKKILIIGLGVLVLADMWVINKRYLNNNNFVNKKETKTPYKPSQADLIILEDKDPDYRVLNLAVSTFNDASTSYFHKSIGGYHGAKLKRYQELIEYQLTNNIQNIQNAFKQNPTDSSIAETLSGQQALNMLNAKYIIYNPEAAPLYNSSALGNVWFVQNYNIVANADSEIIALSNFNPSTTVIVDAVFQDELKGFNYKDDSTATIKLTDYRANDLKYESKASSEQIAVFSEIYYKNGWNAYIDGKPASYFRVNYILRAMRIPAGTHKIEFKFEPSLYNTGENISLASSALLIILSLGILFIEVKKKLTSNLNLKK